MNTIWPTGIFTDGDLRRNLQEKGESFLQQTLRQLPLKPPYSIDADQSLLEASEQLKAKQIDTLAVTEAGELVGLIDVQHLLRNG